MHPDDALAKEFTGDTKARGKTEAWYVYKASDDAELIHGLQPGATPAQVRGAEGEAILPLVSRFRPTSGQLLFTPAGQVHALGPGNLIYGVQQSCDLTYRFYDWGRDREIHPDKAAECVKRAVPIPANISPDALQCEYFHMELVNGPVEWEVSADSFQILATTADSNLSWDGGRRCLKAGQSVLLPAGLGKVTMEGVFLRVSVP